MIHNPEPRSKKEKRVLHRMLGALGATREERKLAFMAYDHRGYADALRYVEELKRGRHRNRPKVAAEVA